MSLVDSLLKFTLHIDQNIIWLINKFGTYSYLILFIIIFLETGLVFTPFLPGDSLVFAVGAISAVGALNVFVLFIILCLAAILGDSANYAIGHFIGRKIIAKNFKIIKKEYIEKTQKFYDKYGVKTIVLARFVPIVRTFAPFLAGIGAMQYGRFLIYNVIGGIAWVAFFLFAGYFFGNISFVKSHFTYAIIIIIILSFIPLLIEIIKHRREKKKLEREKK